MSNITRKLVVIGDTSCGKTSLLTAFTQGRPASGELPTLLDLEEVVSPIAGSRTLISLWDTANQGEFAKLRSLSYISCDVVLICFSIDSPESLSNVATRWAPEVRHFCGAIPTILVGCKKDLRREENPKASTAFLQTMTKLLGRKKNPRSDEKPKASDEVSQVATEQVTPKEAVRVCRQIGATEYVECSAATFEGVRKVFETAAQAVTHYKSG
ncbi:P-loop containing nucleoside triphosphate hydrolase protein [Aspergillus pseudonomiae]|uniref:P-loop containing nucleoside triphosphate hydrolase protein n=1 Tax=Aspergillus pseudonomiae TaxID=1506151 RepID=A0A5N6I721_9EURO|nr:P-loop containing nucleoside triphosphate hydrolase protein [Aspergillus pseudonomiae]KAB8262472.1 P-loop containing nucleoside triphosphate hydrolase protein [Aspergillus pseudonomiae]KAE8402849.1 P-loop containing nucleoside triphosphate hydrolase protein [Aspergillus pseudonomiae]